MKKLFTVILAVMCAVMFTACGGATGPSFMKDKTDFSTFDYTAYTESDKIAEFNLKNPKHLKTLGRCVFGEEGFLEMHNSGSGFEVSVLASEVKANFNVSKKLESSMYIQVYINDAKADRIKVSTGETVIASNLDNTKRTNIRVVKATENDISLAELLEITTDGTFLNVLDVNRLKIEVYGDSLSTGYGALGDNSINNFRGQEQDCTATYAYKIAEAYNADIHLIAHQGWAVKESKWGAGNIPDIYDQITDTNADKWDFSKFSADIVIIKLGSNDKGYMGAKYYEFVKTLREKHPNAIILCLSGMMDSSTKWQVEEMLELHGEEPELKNVYHVDLGSGLNAGAGGHSSEAQHKDSADLILEFIETI